MKPIVHGLERTYQGRLDVLYFDISDKKTAGLRRKFRVEETPHFTLLKKDGKRVKEWTGVIVTESEFKAAIDELLKEHR